MVDFQSVIDPFSHIVFQPVKVNGKRKECELVSVQHKMKNKGVSSEIIVRVGLELMESCDLSYGDTVFIEYGEFGLDRVVRITKEPVGEPYPATLSRQNKSKNSAGIVRFTYKNGIGIPDFIQVESEAAKRQLKRVKYLHEDDSLYRFKGKCEFKLKLSVAD